MKKLLVVLILSLVLFSCKEEVKPTKENLSAIVNSNEFVILVDVVGGGIAGSYTDQMTIQVKNNYLISRSDFQKSSKDINEIEKDSLKTLLNKLVELHVPDKTPLKYGGCTIHDENYTIENDSIRIKIKPPYNNSIYYKIVELIK